MGHFNLDDYETVDSRIHRFWEAYPDGRLLTVAEQVTEDHCLFRAEVYLTREDERPVTTGYAHERTNDGYINKTSHVENGETSAIGRALANLGMNPKGSRPSQEEMQHTLGPDAPITHAQQQALVAAADGLTKEQAVAVMVEVAGVESSSSLTQKHMASVMERLREESRLGGA